jgi:N-acetylneuraminic acid mutarotase
MHTATRLNDGRILLAGGSNGVDDQYALVEIYDQFHGDFTLAAPLNTGRHDHTATLLQDGRVLVVGGYNSRQPVGTNAEVYDPWLNTWTIVPSIYAHGVQHSATLLADGRVLVIGGCSGGCPGVAELFNPRTNSWSAAPSLSSDAASHSALLLADGRVLVAGGTLPGSGALIYDPQANGWTPTGSMSSQHAQAAMVRLLDGRVLIAGGINYLGAPVPLGSTEIYNPATNTWSPVASLSQPRYAHLLALLPGGQVAAVGGARVYEFASAPSTAETYALAIELYDPETNRWVSAAELPLPITYAEVVSLSDGRLWVTGGGAGEDSAKAWANTWVIMPVIPQP